MSQAKRLLSRRVLYIPCSSAKTINHHTLPPYLTLIYLSLFLSYIVRTIYLPFISVALVIVPPQPLSPRRGGRSEIQIPIIYNDINNKNTKNEVSTTIDRPQPLRWNKNPFRGQAYSCIFMCIM